MATPTGALPGPEITPQLIRDQDKATYDALLLAMREGELWVHETSSSASRRYLAALDRLDRAVVGELRALGALREKIRLARERPLRALRELGEEPGRAPMASLASAPAFFGESTAGYGPSYYVGPTAVRPR